MKFQVIKCAPMESKPGSSSSWRATMVKGLFTDDLGEVEMVEVMMFGDRGQNPPTFTTGELLSPVFQVRRSKVTQRPEFVIGSLQKIAATKPLQAA